MKLLVYVRSRGDNRESCLECQQIATGKFIVRYRLEKRYTAQ